MTQVWVETNGQALVLVSHVALLLPERLVPQHNPEIGSCGSYDLSKYAANKLDDGYALVRP